MTKGKKNQIFNKYLKDGKCQIYILRKRDHKCTPLKFIYSIILDYGYIAMGYLEVYLIYLKTHIFLLELRDGIIKFIHERCHQDTLYNFKTKCK